MKMIVALMLAVFAASALAGCRAEVDTKDQSAVSAPR